MPLRSLTLDDDALARLFPFHFSLDESLSIVGHGPSLARLDPQLVVSKTVVGRLVSERPVVPLRFETLASLEGHLVLLRVRAHGPRLRGQWVYSPEQATVTFLGSPWITSKEELQSSGLRLMDFAVHDPMADLLYMRGEGGSPEPNSHAQSPTGPEQLERALWEARAEAEAANEAKGDFLALMSHELRTPLNAILGMNELARTARSDKERQEWTRRIDENALILCRMVEDMLELSQVDTAPAAPEEHPLDVTALLERVVAPFGFLALRKGVEIIVEVAPDTPRVVQVDDTRLQSVLASLVGNAVKFTDEGHVHVSLRPDATDGQTTKIHIDVTDTGIGLAPEQHETIFERFFRIDTTTTRAHGGPGLGLSLARENAALLGGEITVTSTLGEGSRFGLTIPVHVVDATHALDSSPQQRPPIVVAEPYGPLREATARTLRRLGFRVRPCEAWDGTPEPHGTIVLRSVHHQSSGTSPYRFLVTASHASEGLVEHAKMRLAAKPLGPYALLRLLTGSFDAPLPEIPAVQKSDTQLRVLMAEDNEDSRALVRAVMDRAGHHLDEAVDGVEALKFALANRYDIILLDVEMPKIDGIEVATRLRRRERSQRLPRTPMLAVTAHALPEHLKHAREAGIDECVTKPVSPRTLLDIVERHCRDQPRVNTPTPKSRARTTATNPVAGDLPPPLGPGDLPLDVDAASLLPVFIKTRRRELASLSTLLEAGDFRPIMRIGHNLKGTGTSYGFPQLSDLGARLETSARQQEHDPTSALIAEFVTLMARIERWAADSEILPD